MADLNRVTGNRKMSKVRGKAVAQKTMPRGKGKTAMAMQADEKKQAAQKLNEAAKLHAKVRAKQKEIEAIEKETQCESLQEKIKRILFFCPKMCVNMGVCKLPKAMCAKCGKVVQSGMTISKKGLEHMGSLTLQFYGTAKSAIELPVLRRKIRKTFGKIGVKTYELYLAGDKHIVQNVTIKEHMKRVKEYEKSIEKIESKMMVVGSQNSVPQPA